MKSVIWRRVVRSSGPPQLKTSLTKIPLSLVTGCLLRLFFWKSFYFNIGLSVMDFSNIRPSTWLEDEDRNNQYLQCLPNFEAVSTG